LKNFIGGLELNTREATQKHGLNLDGIKTKEWEVKNPCRKWRELGLYKRYWASCENMLPEKLKR
jgi:hypothetical protein